MAIAGYVDPRKYYSNKDWGQTAFNIANGGLEMANTIMGKVGNVKKNKNGALGSAGKTGTGADAGTINSTTNSVGDMNTSSEKIFGASDNSLLGKIKGMQGGGAGTGSVGASGTGGKGGMSGGVPWGAIGAMGNQLSQLGVKMIGNQFKEPGQRIAYGDSTTSTGSRKDLNRQTNNYINALQNESFYSNANSFGDLQNEINSGNIYRDQTSNISKKQGAVATTQSFINNSGKGFELGMKIGGPWGGLIGAAAGGIAGIFGGIFRTKSARRRLRRIQEAERYNNTMKDKQVQGSISNLTQKNLNNQLASSLARGGNLYTFFDKHTQRSSMVEMENNLYNIFRQ